MPSKTKQRETIPEKTFSGIVVFERGKIKPVRGMEETLYLTVRVKEVC